MPSQLGKWQIQDASLQADRFPGSSSCHAVQLTLRSSSRPERKKMMARAIARNSLDQVAGKPFTKCPLLMLPTAMPTRIMPRGPGSCTCVRSNTYLLLQHGRWFRVTGDCLVDVMSFWLGHMLSDYNYISHWPSRWDASILEVRLTLSTNHPPAEASSHIIMTAHALPLG